MHSTGEIYSFAFWLNDYQLRASALTLEIIRLRLSLRNRAYLSVLATLLLQYFEAFLAYCIDTDSHRLLTCFNSMYGDFSLCC